MFERRMLKPLFGNWRREVIEAKLAN